MAYFLASFGVVWLAARGVFLLIVLGLIAAFCG